jgi:hypothetical protein
MILAHSFTPGGPDIEFLVLAFAMLSLAIVFFFQKSVKRQVPVVLIIVAIALVAGAFTINTTPTVSGAGIKVAIASPPDGTKVEAGKPVKLQIDLTGGKIVTGASSDPKAGHFHVYVDRQLVDMPTSATPDVTLSEGSHTVTVEFTNAQHASFSPRILDEIVLVAR